MHAIRQAIALLTENQPLSEDLAGEVAGEILDGSATPAQIGAFLVALRIRGEQPEHLRAFARSMRAFASPVAIEQPEMLIDTCGTGGDGANTFNVSTAAALVAAAAGARIAKHGNRAVTGAPGSGSADVLAALGVNIECPTEVSIASIAHCGIGFFFAPAYHQALRHAGPARREIGVRSILNLLGPLANPAGVGRQVIGVGQPGLTDVFARVLAGLGSRHVLVVYGLDGLDELSLLGPTRITEAIGSDVHPTFMLTPEEVGLQRCTLADLRGGDSAAERAEQLRAIFAGEPGPRRETTLLNAAAALRVAGLAPTWPEGLARAARAIDSGAARQTLEALVRFTTAETPTI
jgi:anthranilate phosphoribosyltransferase